MNVITRLLVRRTGGAMENRHLFSWGVTIFIFIVWMLKPEIEKWKYESDNYINGAAACANGKAMFGGCDGFLHVVDVATGKLDEKIDVATYVAGSVTVENDKAYIGDYDGRFFQVDLKEKKTTWVWEDEKTHLQFIASPALIGDRVLTANYNKFLYCFDKNTGKKLWEYNTGRQVEASPVIVKR